VVNTKSLIVGDKVNIKQLWRQLFSHN